MRRFSCLFLTVSTLIAAPKEMRVVSGSAAMKVDNEHMQITVSDKAVLHWHDFSIAKGEHLQFVQPSANSAVLNRVQGGEASQILGQLSANGRVYLVNPSGIIFGKDAIIKTGDFLASTLDLEDAAFLVDREQLFSGGSTEPIINYGIIEAPHGNVALIGRVVDYKGTIIAPEGKVSLLAGQDIVVVPQQTQILQIRPSSAGDILHQGKIEALMVDLQAGRYDEVCGINVEGSILALHTVEEKGEIYLRSNMVCVAPESCLVAENGGKITIDANRMQNNGHLVVDGERGGVISIHTEGPYIETLQASVSAKGEERGGKIAISSNTNLFTSAAYSVEGERGGEISFAAPKVTLVSAEINASGTSGGGEVFIGGDAAVVHIAGNNKIFANAEESGSGGKVVILSQEKTICHGIVEAKGGRFGGDGGFIEISSKGDLYTSATLTAEAAKGLAGTVLFDPKNIVVDAVTGIYPQYEFIDPSTLGSGFGQVVFPLSTGNVVVTKPNDGASGEGAVYLYNGLTAGLVSVITGSFPGDQVGDIESLGNGNFLIQTPTWNSNRGALTFGNGVTGVTGSVSALNSLVGSTPGDQVGFSGTKVFQNAPNAGNYLTENPNWSGGIGAVTWGSGLTGVAGTVSASNSLVGSAPGDSVGSFPSIELTNGNYVVGSPNWSSGMGAVTWGNGSTGITGTVTSSNSLVGGSPGDAIGGGNLLPLTNGNYVVFSPQWSSNTGAVTWGNGATGITGTVSVANSLVGSIPGDLIGSGGVALTNGNYVTISSNWSSGMGAATWGDGTTGITGTVSALNSFLDVASGTVYPLTNGNYIIASPSWSSSTGAVTWANGAAPLLGSVSALNSLVGSVAGDAVGGLGLYTLANGNYVGLSPQWSGGIGAVTFGNGATGVVGVVTSANSLVGSVSGDLVGGGVITELTNGNYVVGTSSWSSGRGAVTWGNGTTGVSGVISAANSLVGSTPTDQIGNQVIALESNGNYVTFSSNWDNLKGAVTWGDGLSGVTGVVSAANSLVGSSSLPPDKVGSSVQLLTNGNYVVLSFDWDNTRGAVTWGNGLSGVTGSVSATNSLVGSTPGDQLASEDVFPLVNGNYVVCSSIWSSNTGAATWGNGLTGVTGVVSASNSLVGTVPGDKVGFGAQALGNGDYVVASPLWNSQTGALTYGNGVTGITGTVTVQNSLTGQIPFAGLSNLAVDDVNDTFIGIFSAEGKVRVALFAGVPLTFARAQEQNMTIPPSAITDTLNAGTSVILQANDDITISSPMILNPGAGDLTLRAGRSAAINGSITTGNGNLSVIANDPGTLSRSGGNGSLSVGNGVTIDTGTGDLTLSLLNTAPSGDITIGDSVTLQASGAGQMTITAEENNITFGNNVTLQTQDGPLFMSAGKNISAVGGVTVQTLGTGQLTMIVDALFPTRPSFGSGSFSLPNGILTTGGGKLLIYTAERSLNTMPVVINGVSYTPGPLFVDSTTEKWGVYYPNSSGIPFTIFYKNKGLTALPPKPLYRLIIALAEPFQIWNNPWYNDFYFAVDEYPPYLTPKNFRLTLPSLVEIEE